MCQGLDGGGVGSGVGLGLNTSDHGYSNDDNTVIVETLRSLQVAVEIQLKRLSCSRTKTAQDRGTLTQIRSHCTLLETTQLELSLVAS